MILTTCAACAAPLAHDAPRCIRCKLRYCKARRFLGKNHQITLMLRKIYGDSLCRADGATLDDVREAVETLEDTERTARRVLGAAHPTTVGIERSLRESRQVLSAHEKAHTRGVPVKVNIVRIKPPGK